ncbi:energy-coupled thiamine transporter ThiT [Enterococcus faecium]|nr:energy-coupled thiamine transporter ThiT [Enterococcus faecium]
MGKNRVWVEGTIVAALAMVLSLIPIQIGSSFSISLGQIPLTLFALRRGTKAGMLAGFIWGILHFPLGQVYYLSVVQVLIEYPIAYTFAGAAGNHGFKCPKGYVDDNTKQIRKNIVFGALIGAFQIFLAFYCRSGFLGSVCTMGMNPWLFSFVMNGASGLSTAIVTIIVLLGIQQTIPSIFVPDKRQEL